MFITTTERSLRYETTLGTVDDRCWGMGYRGSESAYDAHLLNSRKNAVSESSEILRSEGSGKLILYE